MKAAIKIGLSTVFLVLFSCGMFTSETTSEIKLEEFTLSVTSELASMGESDRVEVVFPGRTLKLGNERPATFRTDTNLLSGPGYLYEGEYTIWLQRGLKDNWFLIYSRNLESNEYLEEYDSSILPLNYRKVADVEEDLSIYLTTQDDNGLMLISWGVHRFNTGFTLPPSKK
ncbi:MAG: DUF2911 domain-containing protein [Candidatus Latescibacteria bacterium]|jgi:hypothetical protein|nr:DUF2911 domain-containing protein [Candidatus Latescibacterota bacterium]